MVATETMQLFREIMRLHRTKLPTAMRSLGDTYVRKEFRVHCKADVKPAHLQMFTREWQNYVQHISMQATVKGEELSEEQRQKLNSDQQQKLADLERYAKAV
mmetsp:Transcript_53736/g.143783  ORF Transcript_53736/g.143783 Transcript_53736/m.143783 type:complete len:102 (-) Transcript_53736:64-369(-)